jgi:hypothetical protein
MSHIYVSFSLYEILFLFPYVSPILRDFRVEPVRSCDVETRILVPRCSPNLIMDW